MRIKVNNNFVDLVPNCSKIYHLNIGTKKYCDLNGTII